MVFLSRLRRNRSWTFGRPEVTESLIPTESWVEPSQKPIVLGAPDGGIPDLSSDMERLARLMARSTKAAVFDIDGTLTHEGNVPDEVVSLLAQKVDQGIFVVLASGRPLRIAPEGVWWGRTRSGVCDIEGVLEQIRPQVRDSAKLRFLITAEQVGSRICNSYPSGDARRKDFDTGVQVLDEKKCRRLSEEILANYGERMECITYKGCCLSVALKPEFEVRMPELKNDVKKLLIQEGLAASAVMGTSWIIDIVSSGSGKASVLRFLKDPVLGMGLTDNEIVTVGDSENDIPMIDREGGFFVGGHPLPSSTIALSMPGVKGLYGVDASRWLLESLNFVPADNDTVTDVLMDDDYRADLSPAGFAEKQSLEELGVKINHGQIVEVFSLAEKGLDLTRPS